MSSITSSRASTHLSVTPGMDYATTPPSSPPPAQEVEEVEEEDVPLNEDTEKRVRMLESLIEKSSAYVSALKLEMDKAKVHARGGSSRDTSTRPQMESQCSQSESGGKKRVRNDRGPEEEEAPNAKRTKVDSSGKIGQASSTANSADGAFEQPALITGATLKDYQLEGVAWMAGLHKNGISGILADEMGLGKTLQTIAFHAFLRGRTVAPFLVVCPLSVLNNWVEEFRKFAPDIPVVMYHGTPDERAEIRRTEMVLSETDMKYQNRMFGREGTALVTGGHASANKRAKNKSATPKGRKGKAPAKKTAPPSDQRRSGRLTTQREEAESDPGEPSAKPIARRDNHRGVKTADGDTDAPVAVSTERAVKQPSSKTARALPPHQKTNFPVVITTYEMVIRDRAPLSEYYWGFIVVDEGHRLKNLDCKLMREIKKLPAAARMVLTGTPLHNNLSELWALLNFVLPDVFSDLEAFEEWFNLPVLQSMMSSSRSTRLIQSLHTILRPFLLRRLKTDVETSLPPKKEYVLYAPLSERQRELYDAIVNGGLRALLVKEGGTSKGKNARSNDEEEDVPLSLEAQHRSSDGKMKSRAQLRQSTRKRYDVDGDDDEYFERLESGEVVAEHHKTKKQSAEEMGRDWQRENLLKKVSNMRLQNTVMQLRKVCSHPFLFDWPTDAKTREPILNEELVTASGKMLVLDRLLDALFATKHKVLLFSQFTTMLDIIEDWARELKGWSICRIDGSTSMAQRREEVNRFQNSDNELDAPQLFLLSTRAGGLGLNLVAADTVIFYDQDWNPQMDLQAQDRAHRIGQTKPVLIFRLVSAHTIETRIMQRANEKRKLEALVIAKGQFKTPTLKASRNRPETIAEMAAALLRLEGEQIQVVPNTAEGKASVISDGELEMLLDRRPEVFVDRGKGWTSAGNLANGSSSADGPADHDGITSGPKAKFAVYEATAHSGGDVLAGMLDGDEDS